MFLEPEETLRLREERTRPRRALREARPEASVARRTEQESSRPRQNRAQPAKLIKPRGPLRQPPTLVSQQAPKIG